MFPDVKLSSSRTGGKQYELPDGTGVKFRIQYASMLTLEGQEQPIASFRIGGERHELPDGTGVKFRIQYASMLTLEGQEQPIASSRIGGEQHELLDATGVQFGIQDVSTLSPVSQQQFIVELVKKCFELAGELWEKGNTINQMKMQIGQLNEKMAISSIAFDLPEDYYENDEYLV